MRTASIQISECNKDVMLSILIFHSYNNTNGMAAQVNGSQVGQVVSVPCGPGLNMRGSYSYIEIDHNQKPNQAIAPQIVQPRITVTWVADANGFQPTIANSTDSGSFGFDILSPTNYNMVGPDAAGNFNYG